MTNANGEHDEQGVLAQSSYDLAGNTLMHADSDLSMSTQIPRVQSVPTIGKNRYYIKQKKIASILIFIIVNYNQNLVILLSTHNYHLSFKNLLRLIQYKNVS